MSSFIRRAGPAALVMILAGSCGGPRVLPPDVKLNPSPKERYEIALTIESPPGPVRIGDAWAQMDVENPECMPLADRIAGIKPDSTSLQSLSLKPVGDNTYVGYVYADYYLEEDYYEQGICAWKITTIRALIYIGKIEQSAHIDGELVTSQKSALNLCPRPETDPVSPDICSRPRDGNATDNDRKFNYIVVVKSRKISQ